MIPNCGIARFARVSLGKTEPKTSIDFHCPKVDGRSIPLPDRNSLSSSAAVGEL
jgi:hypothetical protein